ncbi:MAG: PAS domain S-box protein [Bacteroidales bacterium]
MAVKAEDQKSTFAKITQHIPGLMYQFLMKPDGTAQMPFANDKLTEIFGITPSEVKEDVQPIFDLIHPDDIQLLQDTIQQSRENLSNWEYDFRIIDRHQNLKYLSGVARPEKMDDGSTLWYGYIIDNTQKHLEEQKINETRAKYQGYFENVPDALFVVDRRGNYLEANPSAASMTGYTQQELLKMNVKDLVHPDYHTTEFNTLEKSFLEGSVDHEIKLLNKEGVPFWVRLVTSRINENKLVAFCHDITERIHNARILEDQLEFHKILSSITSVFVNEHTFRDFAIKSLEQTGLFFQVDNVSMYFFTDGFASKEYEWNRPDKKNILTDTIGKFNMKQFSWCSNKLKHKEKLLVFNFEDHTDIPPPEKDILQQNCLQSVVCIPMINKGVMMGFIKLGMTQKTRPWQRHKISQINTIAETLTGIFSKAKLEKDLRESENRYRLLAENAKDAIFKISFFPRRQFEYVSPSSENLTGYTPEEFYKDPFLDLRIVHPNDRQTLKEVSRKSEYFTKPLTIRLVRKDGKMIWSEHSNAPVYDQDGTLIAIEGIARDITGQMETQEQLTLLNKELTDKKIALETLNKSLKKKVKKEVEKNRKLDHLMALQARQSAMGEMIGNIAHQWRQPLNLLSLAIYDLDDAFRFGELDKEYMSRSMEEINSIIQKMSKTIDDFRNYFQPQKKKTYFHVHDIIKMALLFLSSQLEENSVKVQRDVPTDILVYGYTTQLEQVIISILKNALDAMQGLDEENRIIKIKAKAENDDICIIDIFNTGKPIRKEHLTKLFDPYFTTKPEGKGMGLGLYVAKVIMEKNMSGRIQCHNIKEGVKFSLIFHSYQNSEKPKDQTILSDE